MDEDSMTGRTLRRTVRELTALEPKSIDLLLMLKTIPIGK